MAEATREQRRQVVHAPTEAMLKIRQIHQTGVRRPTEETSGGVAMGLKGGIGSGLLGTGRRQPNRKLH